MLRQKEAPTSPSIREEYANLSSLHVRGVLQSGLSREKESDMVREVYLKTPVSVRALLEGIATLFR